MKYTFPHINTIEDILPHIEGKEEFIVIDKDDYKVVDYILQSPVTFPIDSPILRECRGLIFDKEGKLISRPFHKFFNYGEKPEEQAEGLPSEVLQKLDGSMIRPLVIDGDIRLATRKGITDVAMQAETFAAGKENYITFISCMEATGCTPIFEWCSRKNQVVIDYPEDKLVLLAIREKNSGKYVPYGDVVEAGSHWDIPVVRKERLTPGLTSEQLAEFAKVLTDEEGFVMVWPDGHRMKAKAEWYVTLHRAKEAIGREKDLIKAYLTTGIDDILPILPDNYKKEVTNFLAKLTVELAQQCQRLDGIFVNIVKKMPDSFTRKDFAMEALKLHERLRPFMFSLLPGRPCMEVVIPVLIRACNNRRALDEYRWLIGGIRFDDKEAEAA